MAVLSLEEKQMKYFAFELEDEETASILAFCKLNYM